MNEVDILTAALRAEGLTDDAIARVRDELATNHLSVTVPYYVQDRLDREASARNRALVAERELNIAVPYAGVIIDCQATVWSTGRGAMANRCQKRARFVVRREERFSGHGEQRTDPPVDGRLAVCRTHAVQPQSHRHHGHWSYERCAVEAVEPEYQP